MFPYPIAAAQDPLQPHENASDRQPYEMHQKRLFLYMERKAVSRRSKILAAAQRKYIRLAVDTYHGEVYSMDSSLGKCLLIIETL